MSERDAIMERLTLVGEHLLSNGLTKASDTVREAVELLRADGARPAGAYKWGTVFVTCDKCVTATHCANHGRCLSECVPADLAAALSPTGAPEKSCWCPECGGDPSADDREVKLTPDIVRCYLDYPETSHVDTRSAVGQELCRLALAHLESQTWPSPAKHCDQCGTQWGGPGSTHDCPMGCITGAPTPPQEPEQSEAVRKAMDRYHAKRIEVVVSNAIGPWDDNGPMPKWLKEKLVELISRAVLHVVAPPPPTEAEPFTAREREIFMAGFLAVPSRESAVGWDFTADKAPMAADREPDAWKAYVRYAALLAAREGQ